MIFNKSFRQSSFLTTKHINPTMKAERFITGPDTDSTQDVDLTLVGGDSPLFDKIRTTPSGPSIQKMVLQESMSSELEELSDHEGDPKNPKVN